MNCILSNLNPILPYLSPSLLSSSLHSHFLHSSFQSDRHFLLKMQLLMLLGWLVGVFGNRNEKNKHKYLELTFTFIASNIALFKETIKSNKRILAIRKDHLSTFRSILYHFIRFHTRFLRLLIVKVLHTYLPV